MSPVLLDAHQVMHHRHQNEQGEAADRHLKPAESAARKTAAEQRRIVGLLFGAQDGPQFGDLGPKLGDLPIAFVVGRAAAMG